MSCRIAGFAAVLAVVAAAPATSQARHVDYSGVWVLDASRSTTSGQQLPTAATWTIAQHGDTITTDRETETADAVGPTRTHVVVTTDGNATSNSIPQAGGMMATSSTASWDSVGVVIRTTGNVQGYDFVLNDHWTLAPDGKTLVSNRTITVGDQVVETDVLTFNRKS